MPMKECNSHFIQEVNGTLLQISKLVALLVTAYRAISNVADYELYHNYIVLFHHDISQLSKNQTPPSWR